MYKGEGRGAGTGLPSVFLRTKYYFILFFKVLSSEKTKGRENVEITQLLATNYFLFPEK